MSANMHLAIVTPFPPAITGIGQYGYHITQALAQAGAFSSITVLTSRHDTGGEAAPLPGVAVEQVWDADRAGAGVRIAARLRHLRPDLVWFNLGTTAFGCMALANVSGLLAPLLAQRLGLPTVVTMHEVPQLADLSRLRAPGGRLSAPGAVWATWAMTQADVVCVTLARYADWLSAHWPGRRYLHIPIGVYGEPQWQDEPPEPGLLYFTMPAPFRGLEVLLQAYRILQQRRPDVRLTVAGAEHPRFPGYATRVQQQFRDVTGVRWLGYVPEARVQEIFKQTQVVVVPYVAATGASSVLFQAVMRGRAVVLSDLPELRATVADAGLQAEFFSSGDAPALAAVLDRILCQPKHRAQQVRWNQQAIRRLQPDNTCRSYLHAFNLALQTRCTLHRLSVPHDMTAETVW